jgi:mannose-6-phosphate isomerase-like protein (cupin superfamily)
MRFLPTATLSLWLGLSGAMTAHAQEQPEWEAHRLADLIEQREASGRNYLSFLDRTSVSVGLYELPPGTVDRQSPHRRDEVYYVVSGRAVIEVEDDEFAVAPGSIVYVEAEAKHRFVEIADDLRTLVVFVSGPPAEAGPAWKGFQVADIVRDRSAGRNIWNLFLDLPSLRFGMYMLPEQLGGDETLVHDFDEVNLVVNGKGRFHIDDDVIDIEPGSVVFVRAGSGHSFDSLEGDLDVLILWEGEEAE